MKIKKGQLYIVLKDFKKVGATLYKNQTFEIIDTYDVDSLRVKMIVIDVIARPEIIRHSGVWSLNKGIINKYCEIILRPEDTEETIVKVPIKRYDKKEFKAELKNII